LATGAIVAAAALPAIWIASCWNDALIGERQLASVGNKIVLGQSPDDILRTYKGSAHSKIDVFNDGLLVEGEMLIATPSQLSADNSVLHVCFDDRRRVQCVAFRTESSAWVHPAHMPEDRGCAPADRRLYRVASAP
jgi:hypothetical protein